MNLPYTALLIIPTGIAARVGGFAGDAIPLVRSLSSVVDRLITHPNVLNGASLFWPLTNVLYVEGYGLDQFCQGQWRLRPVRQNRVGVLLDAGIEPSLVQRQIHAMQAAQATLGLSIVSWATTSHPLEISVTIASSGASQGTLGQPDSLLQGVHDLLNQGVEAVAVVGRFPDDLDFDDYSHGHGVDPLAGVEAIISHLVVREFQIPCAHAPALSFEDPPRPVHPRAAAEEVGFTFLPSVLAGLSYAPQFISSDQPIHPFDLSGTDVDVAIAPASAFGGPGLLGLANRERPPLMLAIQENQTLMNSYPQDLGLSVVNAPSYLEAIGLVVGHRAGVCLKSLRIE